jgi:hypothetical protein
VELEPEGRLMNKQGDQSLAAAMSFHPNPKLKQDSRFQTNNPQNLPQPEQRVYGVLYGDGQIVHKGTNLTVTPAPQQQIALYPQGRLPGGDSPVIPGHPGQIAKTQDLLNLDDPRRTTTTAMGSSEQGPQGNPRAAIDRGIPGPMASGGSPRPSGFNTSVIGGRRPLVG